ncbi:uncharacterized protein LOC123448329 [Hordeum vulgare subsp. vulgare]|uniref:uncharacterized protein LOC123448329 n=1 Tax=Hordeum vulgare subsp. vulgare TaxID=112509 RepID=UPI001D1A4055|nr:uncharacterized protein LOC123448329 [Hordeum vulgare subsp. vulgare]
MPKGLYCDVATATCGFGDRNISPMTSTATAPDLRQGGMRGCTTSWQTSAHSLPSPQPAAAEPFSTGGGGDGRAADRQSQPAAEHELQSASPVAPPHGFLTIGQYSVPYSSPVNSSATAPKSTPPRSDSSSSSISASSKYRLMEKKSPSPVTSVGTATKSPLQGSASGNVRPVSSSKKCRLREKKSPPRSGSSSFSPSTHSFKTATGSRRSKSESISRSCFSCQKLFRR